MITIFGTPRPFRGHFANDKTVLLQGIEQVDIKGDIGNAERGMDFFNGRAPHDFGPTLRILDIHPEEQLYERMKQPAENPPLGCGGGGADLC